MIIIDIVTEINPNKLSEFNQTRKELLARIRNVEEVLRLESDQVENNFHLSVTIADGKPMEEIKKSKWYTYLKGALTVLSDKMHFEMETT